MKPMTLPVLVLLLSAGCSSGCSSGDDPTSDAAADGATDVATDVGGDRTDGGSGDGLVDAGDAAGDQAGETGADALADTMTTDLPEPALLELRPVTHDFGHVAKDEIKTHIFTVTNAGQQPSGSLDVKVMNGTLDPDAFAIVANGCESSLEPAATCEIEIRFFANVLGTHEGLLTAGASPGGMASCELKAAVP